MLLLSSPSQQPPRKVVRFHPESLGLQILLGVDYFGAREYVILRAFEQWLNARELCKELKLISSLSTTPIGDNRMPPKEFTYGLISETQAEQSKSAVDLPSSAQKQIESYVIHPRSGKGRGSYQSSEKINGHIVTLEITKEYKSKKPYWWDVTMVAVFFVTMRDLSYDIKHLNKRFNYIALTPKGFLALAQKCHSTPDMVIDNDIRDRSKADSLGKFLSCAQALWMALNVIARKVTVCPPR